MRLKDTTYPNLTALPQCSLIATGHKELKELQEMIESYWRHNASTASKEQITEWQVMIDKIQSILS